MIYLDYTASQEYTLTALNDYDDCERIGTLSDEDIRLITDDITDNLADQGYQIDWWGAREQITTLREEAR